MILLNVNMANKFKKLAPFLQVIYEIKCFLKIVYILKGNWKNFKKHWTTTIGWFGRSLYEKFYLQVIYDPMQMSMFA